MELNREQVIEALECCAYGGDFTEVCSTCPYFHEGNCTDILKENALSLIKELTAKVAEWEEECDLRGDMWCKLNEENKRLTEENERLRSEVSVKRKLLDKADVRIDCLEEVNKVLAADICNATMNLEHITKENERLSAYNENLIKANTYLSDHLLDEVEQAKDLAISDTVRKMKDRIIENACSINMVNSEGQVIKTDYQISADRLDQIAKEVEEDV